MPRLRYNLVETELGADLSAVDTAITFAAVLTEGGVNIPTLVSPDVIPLTIGGTEIVHLTAYTTGASSGTIAREPAQESTDAIAHIAGETVQHNPTKLDYGHYMAVFVAASNAPAFLKAGADFICDGTADDVQINAAVALLAAGDGGKVFLSPGEFYIDAAIVLNDDISIEGMTPTSYVVDGFIQSDTQIFRDQVAANFVAFSCPTTQTGVSLRRLSVSDSAIVANTSPLISISSAGKVEITDCVLDNQQTSGRVIELTANQASVAVRRSYLFSSGSTIFVNGTTQTGNEIELEGTEIYADVASCVDLTVGGSCILRVTDSVLYGETNAIRVDGNTGSTPMPRVEVLRSKVDATSDIVYLTDILWARIEACNLQGGGEHSIRLSNVDGGIIRGNEQLAANKHGVWALDCDKLIICDNLLLNCSTETDNTYSGIILDGDTNDCLVEDNKIWTDGAGNLPLYGIRIDDSTCDNNTVINNDLRTSSKTAGNEFSDAGTTTVAGLEPTVAGHWLQDNVAASQAAVVLNMGTGRTEVPIPAEGYVTGIVVFSNEARVTGTLTVDATINGTVTGLTAVLDGTNTTTKATRQGNTADKFTAGQRIGVKITTDVAWLPITADITVVVYVTLNVANRV